jgi:hypothetical protein
MMPRSSFTAETVIGPLEHAEDHKALEAAITADYDAQSAAEGIHIARLFLCHCFGREIQLRFAKKHRIVVIRYPTLYGILGDFRSGAGKTFRGIVRSARGGNRLCTPRQ